MGVAEYTDTVGVSVRGTDPAGERREVREERRGGGGGNGWIG